MREIEARAQLLKEAYQKFRLANTPAERAERAGPITKLIISSEHKLQEVSKALEQA